MRVIVAVGVGYVAMVAIVTGGHAASWARLGADEAFRPGGWDVTPRWIAISLAVGMVAAIAGGFVCAWIGRGLRAPRLLAGVVFGMGVLLALASLGADPPVEPRPPGELAMSEAMRSARTPPWVAFANAIVGAVGVLLGAQRRQLAVEAAAHRAAERGEHAA